MLGELAAALKEEKDRAAKGYVVARNKGENEMAAYAVAMVAQQLAKVIAKEYRGFDQQARRHGVVRRLHFRASECAQQGPDHATGAARRR